MGVGGSRNYEKSFTEPACYFVFQVVHFATLLGAGGCTFFLEVFRGAIEDLEGGCSWDLDRIRSNALYTPTDGRRRY